VEQQQAVLGGLGLPVTAVQQRLDAQIYVAGARGGGIGLQVHVDVIGIEYGREHVDVCALAEPWDQRGRGADCG
jgi:hypothetical protein